MVSQRKEKMHSLPFYWYVLICYCLWLFYLSNTTDSSDKPAWLTIQPFYIFFLFFWCFGEVGGYVLDAVSGIQFTGLCLILLVFYKILNAFFVYFYYRHYKSFCRFSHFCPLPLPVMLYRSFFTICFLTYLVYIT